MANRLWRTTAAFVAAGVLAAGLTVSNPAGADPSTPTPTTVAGVQQELGKLALQSSQLVELYNQASEDVRAKEAAAGKAELQAADAAHQFGVARARLATSVAAAYEGGSFSSTGALLTSHSGESYLDQLQTLSMLSSHNATVVSELTSAARKATAASKNAAALLAEAKQKRADLVKRKAAVQAKITAYQVKLAALNAAQRQAYLALANQRVAQQVVDAEKAKFTKPAEASAKSKRTLFQPDKNAGEKVNKAISFALSQLGKPYVWGAGGPSSYDCSGLTSAAYRAAGISLPHSAAQQYNFGRHVSLDSLKAGDLVFWYQPIGHVAIYLGDGLIVHAPTSGQDVSVVPLASVSGYWAATRLVG